MRIVVTGGAGGLGSEVPHVFTDDDVTLLSRAECDVTDAKQVESVLTTANPEVIIHAAAYTAVDQAEAEPKIAHRVNVDGTANVARTAKKLGARLVYPSTDYVFDGQQPEPYTETDPTNPLSVYGRTKLQGEQVALAEHDQTFVVRTSWLYSHGGKSFVETIRTLLAEKSEVSVIDDQVASPTYSRDYLQAIRQLLGHGQPGLYHAAADGQASWYGFAREIAEHEKSSTPVKPTTTAEWGAPAERPPYSKLDCGKLAKLGITLPDWKAGLTCFFGDVS